MYYVYLLRLVDDRVYVGHTGNIAKRVAEHKEGKSPATRDFRPVMLISYICVQRLHTAKELEKFLKAGTGRAFQKKRLGL